MSEKPEVKSLDMSQEQILASRNKEYDTYVDLFKFYVDTTLKVTVWFYTVTGAILAFHFGKDNFTSLHTTVNALLLPFGLSIALAIIFYGGAAKAKEMETSFKKICWDLKMVGAPHVGMLIWSLYLFAHTFIVVGVVLLWYWHKVVFH